MLDDRANCEAARLYPLKGSKSDDKCAERSGDWAWAEDEDSEQVSTEDEELSMTEDFSEADSVGEEAVHIHDFLGGSYCEVEYIGCGGFGEVYMVQEEDTGDVFAAKFAEDHGTLVWEAEMLQRVSDMPGFPHVHYCGVKGSGAVLVVDLLGYNLSELHSMCGNRMSLKTVLMIADQVLQRLEGLHSRGIVHRDIKPQNFMIGRGDKAHTIYAIDLGLANEYWDVETHQHIPFRQGLEFTGTAAYLSARAHSGAEQSRRDDLESVGYMLIGLLQGDLPWERSCDPSCSNQEWRGHCAKQKVTMPLSMICKGCPKQFEQYLMYCRTLEFAQEPDYQYLRRLFKEALQHQVLVDDGTFDWSEHVSPAPNPSPCHQHAIPSSLLSAAV